VSVNISQFTYKHTNHCLLYKCWCTLFSSGPKTAYTSIHVNIAAQLTQTIWFSTIALLLLQYCNGAYRQRLGIKWYQFVSNAEVQWTSSQPLLTLTTQARRLSLFGHIVQMYDWMTSSDHMDEDSPKWSWVPQSHIDWSCQYGSESPGLEVAAASGAIHS